MVLILLMWNNCMKYKDNPMTTTTTRAAVTCFLYYSHLSARKGVVSKILDTGLILNTSFLASRTTSLRITTTSGCCIRFDIPYRPMVFIIGCLMTILVVAAVDTNIIHPKEHPIQDAQQPDAKYPNAYKVRMVVVFKSSSKLGFP